MRALLLTDQGLTLDTAYPTPEPAAGEALIRIRLAGICATDLHLLAGYKQGYRGVLGHEFVGDVVAAPTDRGWEGQRVVADINVGCGACDLCRKGAGRHCANRTALGIVGDQGCFADYIVMPLSNLHAVPDALTDRQAVFAEPAAAALQPLQQLHIRPDMKTILIGPGKLGLLIAQALAATDCDLTVIGRNPNSLELVRRFGIPAAIAVGSVEFEALPRRSAALVIEATGTPQGFELACALVAPGGTIVLKSTYPDRCEVDVSQLVVNEIRLVGSRCGPFDAALRALHSGHIRVDPLLSAEFALEDAHAAFRHAAQPGVFKVLLTIGSAVFA